MTNQLTTGTLTANEGPLSVARVAAGDVDVAVLAFNRPEKRNALDKHTVHALHDLLLGLDNSSEKPRAVILTGTAGIFSAGGDLKGYQSLYRNPPEFRRFIDEFDAICAMLESSSMISVAMVNGTCVAGGLELALACDFVTVASGARIGDGHLRFGQLPGAGGSQRLVRAIGLQAARKWLLTGRLFNADEAVSDGLALFEAPPDSLRDRTLELVAEVCQHSPLALHRMKELISVALNNGLYDGVSIETDLVHDYATTAHDALEGLTAFAERRRPHYVGR